MIDRPTFSHLCHLTTALLVGTLVVILFLPEASFGSGTILSTGFEAPYVPGDLVGQPASSPAWTVFGGGSSSATVESAIVKSGTQAVQVTKAANSNRHWTVPQVGYPTQRFTVVDWDMRVTQTTTLTAFGPFFGFDTYDADTSPYVLGTLGVDATTGDVLYQAQDSGVLTETGTVVNFNQWYHYRLVLDFGTDSYKGFMNGVQVAATGFVDRGFGLDNFTDADIATFAAQPDAISQGLSASAVFDNVVIRDGLLGDYNLDGVVDNGDYTTWRSSFGNTVSPAGKLADGNGNGKVDAADYVIWRDNRGTSLFAGASLGSDVVPEPCSAALFGMAVYAAGVISRRKRA